MSLFLHRAGMLAGYPGFLLDQYSGAAAAYSLRVLSSAFASSAVIRVRRSSDNAEADFTATEITDGTLTTWTGANDGFVVTWYDQSGNARNATQATAGNQPQIVASGVVVTDPETTKPSVDFRGATVATLLASLGAGVPFVNMFNVIRWADGGKEDAVHIYSGAEIGYRLRFDGAGNSFEPLYQADSSLRTDNYVIPNAAATYLTASMVNNGAQKFYLNGSPVISKTYTTVEQNTNGILLIGDDSTGGNAWQGLQSEIILYPTDRSANRTAIESNIATHYGITLP